MRLKYYLKQLILIGFPISLIVTMTAVATSSLFGLDITISDSTVRFIVVCLFIFLLITIVRYIVFIIFSFVDAIESLHIHYPDYKPMVSILVPAYNEGKVIEASVKSLLSLDYPNYEVIIINDGSTDDTLKKILPFEGKKNGANVTIISKTNSGKAESLNRGLAVAKGQLIVGVDADSKLDSDTLKKLVRHFYDPTVGAVAGNVKVINRNNIWTKLQALEYIEGINFSRRAQSFLRIVNIIPGAIGMFRKKAILDAGGYSDDTFAEDCDLTLKIISNNWKILHEGAAISETEAPETALDLFKQRYRWSRGILQSVMKHKKRIFLPFHNFSTSLTMWIMIFEGLIWPVMNVVSNIFTVYVAVQYGYTSFMVLWWCILTLLEITMALFCIAMEEEDFSLAAYAGLFRIFYTFSIDLFKLFSIIEEFLDVEMTWGKVERRGRL